ncbi:hypothetical protein [Pseudonocardia sp.]|uniref:hypothetical protein n=1 Tax=Pseudonocardia sp. TaxID=60912 RepID=UPI003D0A790E
MRKLLSIVTLASATAFGLVGMAGIASAGESGTEPTTSSGVVTSSINLGSAEFTAPDLGDLTSSGQLNLQNPVGTPKVTPAPSTSSGDNTAAPRSGGVSVPDTMFGHGEVWGTYS